MSEKEFYTVLSKDAATAAKITKSIIQRLTQHHLASNEASFSNENTQNLTDATLSLERISKEYKETAEKVWTDPKE